MPSAESHAAFLAINPVAALASLGQPGRRRKKAEGFGAEGFAERPATAATLLVLAIVVYLVPLVFAVTLASLCKDTAINVVAAVWAPLVYVVVRLLVPCEKRRSDAAE